MKWFNGTIAEAIKTAKSQQAIFVVYSEGEDENSKLMSEVLNTGEICSDLSSAQFVSIKLHSNDVGYRQFVEIYKLVPVPSLYFIGNSGAPIDIVAADSSRANLETKIKEAIGKCNVKSSKVVNNSTMSSPVATEVAGPSTSQAAEQVVTATKVPEVEADAKTDEVDSKPPLEERVEKAKKLLELKKQEKEAKEREEEKQKEFERRKMGQEVLKMKKKQQDKEIQEMIEEREREKRENAAAKQRILDQIAQDRAERLEREQKMKGGVTNTTPNQTKQSTAPSAPPAESPANVTTTRIQFKLPTGEAKAHSFPPNTTLLQVRDFINNNIDLSFNEYRLATTFPRREFTSDDDSSTLLSLNLSPTGVILILPLTVSSVRPNATNWLKIISNLFWDMVQPVFSIANYIQNYFTSGPSSDSQPSEPETSRPPQTSFSFRSRVVVRRSGNIHSLRDVNGESDENNTWNGNSTQQM